MPNKITEAIFNSKKNLSNFYPDLGDIKHFDLEKKQLLYGRIDRQGNAVYLASAANLTEIYAGGSKTELAIDFVSEAFSDLRAYIKKMSPEINKQSLYNGNIKIHKAWRAGDLEWSYYKYVNNLYTNFVEEYLTVDNRFRKIKNFHDFMHQFLTYIGRIAYYFPITRTGYILSNHCSPYISGLMAEIASELHGIGNNKSIIKYVNDPNFMFLVNAAKKFGFMVDKNAPWRLVFNVASGTAQAAEEAEASGAKKYMERYGVQFKNVFDFYYEKAHLAELDNFKNYMFSFYNTFYSQFGTYEEVKYVVCPKGQHEGPTLQSSFSVNDAILGRLKTEQKARAPLPPAPAGTPTETPGLVNIYGNEYWLKIILKLRLLESNTSHDNGNFDNFAKRTIRINRMLGITAALNYINDLTKGMLKTKFIKDGKYWHGESRFIGDRRRKESESNINFPDQVDIELTGVLNKK